MAALHPSLAPRAPSSSPLSSSAPGNCFAEKVRTYHVLYYFTELRLFLWLLQQALLGVKMLNLRTGFTLYVCFQDKGLGDICICRHGNLSTVKQFPVNPSFETRPSYKHKTTFLFFSLISGLFKKIFFFFNVLLSESHHKQLQSGGLSASFAALGICNSSWTAWHAASEYANLNSNNELKISCSNELRGAFKFLYSQEPNSLLSFSLAIGDRWH